MKIPVINTPNRFQNHQTGPQFGAERVYLMRPNNGSSDDYLIRDKFGIEVAAKQSNLRRYAALERPQDFTGTGENGPEAGDYIIFNPAHQDEHVYKIYSINKTPMHFESVLQIVPQGDQWIDQRLGQG